MDVNPIRKCKTPSEAVKNLQLCNITLYTKYLIHTHIHTKSIHGGLLMPRERGREMELEQKCALLYKIDFSVLGVGHLPVFRQRT